MTAGSQRRRRQAVSTSVSPSNVSKTCQQCGGPVSRRRYRLCSACFQSSDWRNKFDSDTGKHASRKAVEQRRRQAEITERLKELGLLNLEAR